MKQDKAATEAASLPSSIVFAARHLLVILLSLLIPSSIRAFPHRHDCPPSASLRRPASRLSSLVRRHNTSLNDHSSGTSVIRAIATDFDGTFLNSSHGCSPANVWAYREAMRRGYAIFPATGRSRPGAFNAMGQVLGEELRREGSPGVYLNGLLVYGPDGPNDLVFTRTMDAATSESVVEMCRSLEASFVAYSGDAILCEQRTHHTDRLATYKEPRPHPIGPLTDALRGRDTSRESSGTRGVRNGQGELLVNKFIILDEAERIDALRGWVEGRLAGKATITQALPTMLEILPLGASKGDGVRRLMEHMQMDLRHMLALGDAENDKEMLTLAGHSVATANAHASVRSVAQHLVSSNDQDGFSEALERLCGITQTPPPPSPAVEESRTTRSSRKVTTTLS